MISKIKKIFGFSIVVLALSVVAIYLISIYLKHFSAESQGVELYKVKEKSFPEGSIVICNATNVYGLAKEMKLFLNSFEIKKIETKNYDTLSNKTRLIANPNSYEFAVFISKLIDFPVSSIEKNNLKMTELVIIIGNDYKLLKPFKN